MNEKPLLRIEGLCKNFPGVKALDNAEFTLRKGEIHALMGENGAGKSTLIKILTGICKKDKGEIYIEGRAAAIRSSKDAQKSGISTVYQEISLCPNLTVAENLYAGRKNSFFVNWKKMNSDARRLLSSLNIPAQPDKLLSSYPIAVQQLIAIARAVDMDCKVLILDEPSSSLDEHETANLFSLMRDLRSKGVGIIFVTHFIDQVYEICDRITVMRDGKFIGEHETSSLSRLSLISEMVGEDLDESEIIDTGRASLNKGSDHSIFLEAADLRSSSGVKSANFTVKKGEVSGLSGLLGSGRSETVRTIFGADQLTGGSIAVNGKKADIRCPYDAMKLGIGYVPENRKNDGIIGDLSVRDNMIIALQALRGFFRPVSYREAEKLTGKYIEELGIKTSSADTPVRNLSGGNQQKVIIARWLLTDSDYLILDEPTRGIDVASKLEIQNIVTELAKEGRSVTFISSEINEMLRVCSEITVMHDKKTGEVLQGSDLTQSGILSSIASSSEEKNIC